MIERVKSEARTAGWAGVRLDDIASRGSGHTPSKRRPEYWGGAISWVSLGDTTRLDRGLIAATAATVTEGGIAHSSAVVHPAGTVILLRGSSVGKSAILGSDMAVSQDYVTWTCGPQINNWYLYYLLQFWKPEFARMGFGNTVKTIGLEYFQTLEVPLPPIREQERIAAALTDADHATTRLKRLIAKKRDIRQGMLQQLLSGRARLPGFSAPWTQISVGDLLDFKNGLNKGSEFFGSGTPIVNFMDVMSGPTIRGADLDGRVTLTRDEIRRFSARAGDVFFTRTSESVEEVGTAAVLVDDVPDACFSGFILRGRPRTRDSDSRFLARAFQLGSVRAQVMSSATYTTRALTNGRSLGRVVIDLPTVEEQRAIAGAIDDAEAEIEALQLRLAKASAVKTGMMQELLTGRIRLPVGEGAA